MAKDLDAQVEAFRTRPLDAGPYTFLAADAKLLDLEVGSVIDYGPAGVWLRVPLGKLATERSVPLDAPTLAALDAWTAQRRPHRPLPHPRTGGPTDFLFTQHGRRLGPTRLRNGLLTAIEAAGLRDGHGNLAVITPHQLRHTYATELANAGMSLQALMALLGHYAGDPRQVDHDGFRYRRAAAA
jgi:integrase